MTGRGGSVIVDVQSLQSPTSRGRGIARFTLEWCRALEEHRPDLVRSYLLNPRLAPPGAIDELLKSGKVAFASGDREQFEGARVYHTLSPLDLVIPLRKLWPRPAHEAGLLLSATVYDLIQARDPHQELTDPIDRTKLRTRLELVRTADLLQVLSRSVARDLAELLDAQSDRVVNVGCAPSAFFSPPSSRKNARAVAIAALARHGLSGPYVLYPSGNHPRKNNEAMIRAFAMFANSTEAAPQLVISGEFPPSTVHHFVHLARELTVQDRVVLPGYVEDAVLLFLYQGADLVCFPSLSEGFGLPVAEALACQTPVIASDRPPLDELVDAEDRFEPTDPSQIAAAALARALTNRAHRSVSPSAPQSMSWRDVAQRSADAFDALISRPNRRTAPSRASGSRRPRIAFVSPLPPLASGVANYSYRLIEEMLRTGEVDVDVFADGQRRDGITASGVRPFNVAALQAIESIRGPYDEVVYSIGNSHNHLGALRMLRMRRGVILSHDVRLSNLYRHAHGDPGLLPGGFARALRAMYGDDLPPDLGADGELSPIDVERYGAYMARDLIAASKMFLVTSATAADLARIDAGPLLADRVAVLPFAMEAPHEFRQGFVEDAAASVDPEPGASALALFAGSPDALADKCIVGHFGIVDPIKLPELLIEAIGALRASHPHVVVAFVGPISEDLARVLQKRGEELGIGDRLVMTGAVSPARYRAWMERTTVAVQLRQASNGEASAAVGECLAIGLPTIASDIGWFSELPRDAICTLRHPIDEDDLARSIASLIDDPTARNLLAGRARDYASAHSFAFVARELLDRLQLARSKRPSEAT